MAVSRASDVVRQAAARISKPASGGDGYGAFVRLCLELGKPGSKETCVDGGPLADHLICWIERRESVASMEVWLVENRQYA